MPQMTWFDGNLGVHRFHRLDDYQVESITATKTVLEYAGDNFDPSRSAFRVELLYTGRTTALLGEDTVVNGGTLTGLRYLTEDSDPIMEVSGLSFSLAMADYLLRDGSGWTLFQHILSNSFTITGAADSQSEDGWDGDDIQTGYGNDTVSAGAGDDYIKDWGGTDRYDGGAGFDVLTYDEIRWNPWNGTQGIVANLAAGRVTGPDGNIDTLRGIEGIKGTWLDDRMTGSKRSDQFEGLGGDDTIDGGKGTDWLAFYNVQPDNGAFEGVDITLANGRVWATGDNGFGGTVRFRNIENVAGSDFDDEITGNAAANRLRGRDGDDTLNGGLGADTLQGEGGEDTFVFSSGAFGNDWVWDFELEEDRLQIAGVDSLSDVVLTDDEWTNDGESGVNLVITVVGRTGSSITLTDMSTDDVGNGSVLFGFA